MPRRFRKPKLKEGELRLCWGKIDKNSTPEMCCYWQGDRSMKRDVNYLFYELGSEKPDVLKTPLFSVMKPSFFAELENRGYDLTTLKFSIQKKQTEEN